MFEKEIGMNSSAVSTDQLNGVNVSAVKKLFGDVQQDARHGMTRWAVTTRWVTGAITETEVAGCEIGGKSIRRSFRFRTDEPHELGGANTFANPQEYLMGAFNACMMVGYVALSSLHGIELESVEIETEGEIDLRGFLGLSTTIKPGYDEVSYRVRIKGNGTAAQFREIHEKVKATSPNRFNISQPIRLKDELVIG